MTSYIRTNSGVAFPVKPDAAFVRLEDITKSLATISRWSGHCNGRYSVLAHAIHVSLMTPPEHRFQALHHDDSEAYLSDIASPFKALLPDYKKVEHALMRQIGQALGFAWPMHPSVKRADAAALYLEREALFDMPVGDDVPYVKPEIEVNWDFQFWSSATIAQLQHAFFRHHTIYKMSVDKPNTK